MALSFTEFTSSYGAIAYTLLAVVITFSTMNSLYRSDRFIAAMSVLVLFVLIFTFFGLRWLSASRAEGTGPQGEWPPIINTCPDFLVLAKNQGKDVCVDILGVAKQTGTTKILKTHTEFRTLNFNTMEEQTGGKYNYFSALYTAGASPAKIEEIGKAAMQFGLSWEGITDGIALTIAQPSAVQTAAAATATSQCAPPPGCPAPTA